MLHSCTRKFQVRVWLATVWFIAVPLYSLTACGGGSSSIAESTTAAVDTVQAGGATAASDQAASETKDLNTNVSVVITTSLGEVRVLLDSDSAPATVANFLSYVDAGHYDQTIFHRVIPGFMIQGGGFSVDYQRNVTELPILNEAGNGLDNDRYTIAMARTPAAHSATDQFFINVADNPFLNYRGPADSTWGYAVFGKVTDGVEVVEQIVSVTTGSAGPFASDAPVVPVLILSIERV